MKKATFSTVVSLSILLWGGLPASAQNSGTVSAKGSGVAPIRFYCAVNTQSQNVCGFGGEGLQFNFNYTAPAPTVPNEDVPATGTFSAVNRNTNTKYEFLTGAVFIGPDFHAISGFGTCAETTAVGVVTQGQCNFSAQQEANPGSENYFNFNFQGPTSLVGANGNPVNGNMQID